MPGDLTHPGLFIKEASQGPHPITGVPTSVTAFVGVAQAGPLHSPLSITSLTEFESHFGSFTSAPDLWCSVRAFFDNGGKQALVVRVRAPSPHRRTTGLPGSRARKTELYALERAERFNFLCLTPVTPGADVPLATYRKALAYCQERRAMLLIDPPAEWEPSSSTLVHGFVNQLIPSQETLGRTAANAMLYVPRMYVDDPAATGALRLIGPSGAVAGVIARTDETLGVWKAPAGTEATVASVSRLPFMMSEDDVASLSSQGINCLRPVLDRIVVWGAHTLDGRDELGSEWKYINVRRFALFLESSIREGLTWVALEPNEEPLWTKVRQVVEQFLLGQWKHGALSGTKPDEAFFVNCDQTTMTQQDVEQGRLVCLIGVAPIRPSEFIMFQIVKETALHLP
ncbi:MAG: phage tail sheath family protein [Nitrospira sp.]|nr:phage tail sheath family protein [Nitrospira sp.]